MFGSINVLLQMNCPGVVSAEHAAWSVMLFGFPVPSRWRPTPPCQRAMAVPSVAGLLNPAGLEQAPRPSPRTIPAIAAILVLRDMAAPPSETPGHTAAC